MYLDLRWVTLIHGQEHGQRMCDLIDFIRKREIGRCRLERRPKLHGEADDLIGFVPAQFLMSGERDDLFCGHGLFPLVFGLWISLVNSWATVEQGKSPSLGCGNG